MVTAVVKFHLQFCPECLRFIPPNVTEHSLCGRHHVGAGDTAFMKLMFYSRKRDIKQ